MSRARRGSPLFLKRESRSSRGDEPGALEIMIPPRAGHFFDPEKISNARFRNQIFKLCNAVKR
jgi:hypothetical protein